VNARLKTRGKALVWVVRPAPGGHEVLLLERPSARGGGLHPVTGKSDARESPAETAAREAREETGLRGALIDLGYEHRFTAGKPGKRVVDWVERAFLLEVPAGTQPRLSEEHVAHRWVPLVEAGALLEWASHRAALERVAERVGAAEPGGQAAGLR
jgi:dATP pyrophosphohydrolase